MRQIVLQAPILPVEDVETVSHRTRRLRATPAIGSSSKCRHAMAVAS